MDVGLESFIHFVIAHNETIIQWLVLLIIFLALAVVGLSIFRPSRGSTLSEANEIGHSGLTKPHGSAAAQSVAVADAGGPGSAAALPADVQKLKDDLDAKIKEVSELKSKASQGESQAEDLKALEEKIKELEGKLAEYEILEDDIADLSLYKEENLRLKEELQRLGGVGSGSSSTKSPEQAVVSPATGGGAGKEDLVKEFKAAIETKSSAETKPPVETTTDKDKGKDASGEEDSDLGSDLLSEFAASLEQPTEGDLDTDKMLAEVAELEQLEDSGGNALDESPNMDKMAEEASDLEPRSSE